MFVVFKSFGEITVFNADMIKYIPEHNIFELSNSFRDVFVNKSDLVDYAAFNFNVKNFLIMQEVTI